jgi:lipopolysaccharide transport system permease protein
MNQADFRRPSLDTQASSARGSVAGEVARDEQRPFLVIRPRSKKLSIDWKAIWLSRELLYFLVWRDILIRYKQTVLGALWEILKPLSLMIVLTVFLGFLLRNPSDGLPYPLFYYSGTLLWTFFSQSLTAAATSVLGASNVVTKIYFPRIIIPVGAVLSNLFDFAMAFGVLLILIAYYGVVPSAGVIVLPFVVLLVTITALGVGLLFAAMIIRYRDVQSVIPVLTMAWMFLSPIMYPMSLIPPQWQLWYCMNPMASALSAFRWGFFGEMSMPWLYLIPGVVSAILLLVAGTAYFQMTERSFADWL